MQRLSHCLLCLTTALHKLVLFDDGGLSLGHNCHSIASIRPCLPILHAPPAPTSPLSYADNHKNIKPFPPLCTSDHPESLQTIPGALSHFISFHTQSGRGSPVATKGHEVRGRFSRASASARAWHRPPSIENSVPFMLLYQKCASYCCLGKHL